MNITKLDIMGLVAASVLACTQMEITQPPVTIVPNVAQNAVGLDVYTKARA